MVKLPYLKIFQEKKCLIYLLLENFLLNFILLSNIKPKHFKEKPA